MSVERRIEFDDRIDDRVESVRRSFEGTEFGRLDYDTAVNMLVLGGLVFPPDDPDDPQWETVYAYLREAEVPAESGDEGYREGTDGADPT